MKPVPGLSHTHYVIWSKVVVKDQQVLDSMRHIIDPDLGRDIVSLGFIKNLVVRGGDETTDLTVIVMIWK